MGKKTVPTFHTRSLGVSLVGAFLLSFNCVATALGQSSGGSFQLTNSVVAGGGGASNDGANNRFSHDSTIGEHAAGTLLRNPPFSQTAGFRAGNIGLVPTAAPGEISGQVLTNNGTPLAGVTVRLNGTQTRLTITNASGDYRFGAVDTGGFYSVTPSRANYAFSPSQRAFSALGNHTDAAFTASMTNGGLNPLDTTEYFVRQQYLDFLNREPDESGFNFWVNNIESCGADANCREVKLIDTSAAFFLSIEFQQTGYLVYRLYDVAYGDLPNAPVPLRLSEFKPDTQEIGQGVTVNQSGWETVLENNKQAFTSEFVQRARFTSAYPTTMTPDQFVDKLFLNAGVTPSSTDRAAAINEFGSATDTSDLAARGRALRHVADNSTVTQQEFNRAFVLMQFLGYLRRNPNDPQDSDYTGYDFWLSKLNQFNGNFVNAEMVKAFIVSGEYRQRFGP